MIAIIWEIALSALSFFAASCERLSTKPPGYSLLSTALLVMLLLSISLHFAWRVCKEGQKAAFGLVASIVVSQLATLYIF